MRFPSENHFPRFDLNKSYIQDTYIHTPYSLLPYTINLQDPTEDNLQDVHLHKAPLPPAKRSELVSFHNKESNKLEYIDIRTGLLHKDYYPILDQGFNNDVADMFCNDIIEGSSLIKTCQKYRVPMSVFYGWIALYPEFKHRYVEARKQRADYHFHTAIDIADGAMTAHKNDIPGLKLAVETHKWAAEKSDPERFNKKYEEQNLNTAIVINLRTGVLDEAAPSDIIVDTFGNFQGFSTGLDSVVIVENEAASVPVELSKERFVTKDEIDEE